MYFILKIPFIKLFPSKFNYAATNAKSRDQRSKSIKVYTIIQRFHIFLCLKLSAHMLRAVQALIRLHNVYDTCIYSYFASYDISKILVVELKCKTLDFFHLIQFGRNHPSQAKNNNPIILRIPCNAVTDIPVLIYS